MQETIITQLKDMIADELDVNLTREEISEEASLFEEGIGLDSMAIVEFISLIEERFSIQFSDAELRPENFKSLSLVANLITRKVHDSTLDQAGMN